MGRSLTDTGDRRSQARAAAAVGHAGFAAKLRTGSTLRVLDTSPDGMLVESPVRLLPGRLVDLVLQSGSTQEQAPWLVVHSRVGCIRGGSDLRYRAGLRRATGRGYPYGTRPVSDEHKLPAAQGTSGPRGTLIADEPGPSVPGTGFGGRIRA